MNVHKNARLTPQGRLLLVRRVTEEGWTPNRRPISPPLAHDDLQCARSASFCPLSKLKAIVAHGLEGRFTRIPRMVPYFAV
jgi:leucine-zipper of insertion element IS481